MNEAEYLMKNCGDRGGCYPSRPWAEADNTLRDLHNTSYYMAESVFALRLVNLRSATCYTDQNFKENAHFGKTSEKRLKLSYKTSINLEDLDFDFVLQHFKLCLFVNEGDEETNS